MIPPIAAVVAGEEPEIAAKNALAAIVTYARPPLKRRKNRLMKSTSFLLRPPSPIRLPQRMNSGIAIS